MNKNLHNISPIIFWDQLYFFDRPEYKQVSEPYLKVLQPVEIWCEIEHDTIVGAGQGEASYQEHKEHDEGSNGSHVHHLQGKPIIYNSGHLVYSMAEWSSMIHKGIPILVQEQILKWPPEVSVAEQSLISGLKPSHKLWF